MDAGDAEMLDEGAHALSTYRRERSGRVWWRSYTAADGCASSATVSRSARLRSR